MLEKQFYIYVHSRPSGEPFYVGKGHSRRAYDLSRPRNPYYQNIVAKYGKCNIQVYVYACSSEFHAFRAEEWMIAWCRKQGYRLANLTNGGEGPAGYTPSDETRARLKARHTPEARARHSETIRGHVMPENTRAALARANAGNKYLLGKKLSEKTRKTISEKSKNMWADVQFRKRMSKKSKAAWDNPERRKRASDRMSVHMLGNTIALGVTRSEATRLKMSQAGKEAWRRRKLNTTNKEKR